jgi:flagellar protein FliO/FliZ
MKNALIISLSAIVLSTNAYATSTLKQVQMANDTQINLLFDKSFDKKNVKIEYFKDIIQLSLTDTLVYPAKISTVNSGSLTKIFAYQYSPKLVRCRFTVKGDAERFKNALAMSGSGKMLTIKINNMESDRVTLQSSQATSPGESRREITQPEDKAVIEKIAASVAPAQPKIKETKEEAPIQLTDSKSTEKKTARHNPLMAFWKLFLIVGVIAAAFIFIRKTRHKMSNSIQKIAKKKFGKDSKLIEVLTTHYLGPNKSIAVVRVTEKLFVIGITNESINLITQIQEDDEVFSEVEAQAAAQSSQGTGAVAGRGFSTMLQQEALKPVSNVKAQIRNKLEGMKPL